MTTWDTKPTLSAVTGPLVLVLREEADLVLRCENALEALPYVRVRSCVRGELVEVTAALQPILVVSAAGHGTTALADTAVLHVSDERQEDLRRLLTDAIRRALVR